MLYPWKIPSGIPVAQDTPQHWYAPLRRMHQWKWALAFSSVLHRGVGAWNTLTIISAKGYRTFYSKDSKKYAPISYRGRIGLDHSWKYNGRRLRSAIWLRFFAWMKLRAFRRHNPARECALRCPAQRASIAAGGRRLERGPRRQQRSVANLFMLKYRNNTCTLHPSRTCNYYPISNKMLPQDLNIGRKTFTVATIQCFIWSVDWYFFHRRYTLRKYI